MPIQLLAHFCIFISAFSFLITDNNLYITHLFATLTVNVYLCLSLVFFFSDWFIECKIIHLINSIWLIYRVVIVHACVLNYQWRNIDHWSMYEWAWWNVYTKNNLAIRGQTADSDIWADGLWFKLDPPIIHWRSNPLYYRMSLSLVLY